MATVIALLLAIALAGESLLPAPTWTPIATDCPAVDWLRGAPPAALDTLDAGGRAACDGVLIGLSDHTYLLRSEADSQYVRERWADTVPALEASLAAARQDAAAQRRRAWWRGAGVGVMVGAMSMSAVVVAVAL